MSADNTVAPNLRPLLPAVVGPRAALVIDRHVGAQLDRLAQGLVASPVGKNRGYGRELQGALSSMRESVRQWQERSEDGPGSVIRTSELPLAPDRSPSEAPPGTHLTVGKVAERLNVSASYVMRLCRDERLSATHFGRAWLIDEESVRDFEAARRT